MQAEYQITNITGLAHELVFTMSCTVGSITEEATANTKKQVKQRVSKKILERLTNTNNPSVANKDECGSRNPSEDCDELSGIDNDVLDELSLKLHNCELNKTESQANVKEKFLNPNVKSYLRPIHPIEAIDFQNYHKFFKQYVYNTVCNGCEEKFIEIFNTVKSFKKKITDIEKCDSVTVTSLEHEILIYIEEKIKLSIEKKTLGSKDPSLHLIAFRINAPIPITQIGAHNNSLIAGAIALANILDTFIIYME
ncbi:hypothetical protein HZH68_012706 [Vespula germanica]|uniref:DRBM domain-containing protein n=1 Tax=Vespula germanica TaxID=30212 RepID=A0A834JH68_VESGE|nr:hypothetical protein HZH68_012706 [Vespula germanica]